MEKTEKSELRVSIVVIAYNEEKYIAKCLKAIAGQTVQPFEVIVVDNNSTDKTAAIARSFDFVKVVSEKQQGRVFAQTTGFNAAHGEIIGRIDADTRLAPDWVEQVTEYFEKHSKIAAASGPCQFYDFPHKRLASNFMTLAYYFMQRLFTGMWTLWGANMAIRRETWESMALYDHTRRTDLDEDIDLSIRLHTRGFAVRFAPKMKAEVSMWRGNFAVKHIMRYTSSWHKNYLANNMPFRAAVIYVFKTIGTLLILPAFLLVRPKGKKTA